MTVHRFFILTTKRQVILGTHSHETFNPNEIMERTMWGLFKNTDILREYGEVDYTVWLHPEITQVPSPEDYIVEIVKLPSFSIVE